MPPSEIIRRTCRFAADDAAPPAPEGNAISVRHRYAAKPKCRTRAASSHFTIRRRILASAAPVRNAEVGAARYDPSSTFEERAKSEAAGDAYHFYEIIRLYFRSTDWRNGIFGEEAAMSATTITASPPKYESCGNRRGYAWAQSPGTAFISSLQSGISR